MSAHMVKKFFLITPYGRRKSGGMGSDPSPSSAKSDKIWRTLSSWFLKSDSDEEIHRLVLGLKGNILDAAVSECARQGEVMEVYDGRQNVQPDAIWRTITEDISGAHGVIGVVANSKPNTFIEIGFAMGLWIKPILLKLDTVDMPSDLNNIKFVEFSKEQALGRADAKDAIADLVELLQKTKPQPEREQPAYLPVSTSSAGQIKTYNRFSDAIKPPEWSSVLWSAEREIILAAPKALGLFNNEWLSWKRDKKNPDVPLPRQVDLEEILFERVVYDGVNLTVLCQDPEKIGPDDQTFRRDGTAKLSVEAMRSRTIEALNKLYTLKWLIEEASKIRGSEDVMPGEVRIVQIKDLRFPHRVTMTDRRLLMTIRLHSELWNTRFSIDAEAIAGPVDYERTPIYHLIRGELEMIINTNQAHSESKYDEWLANVDVETLRRKSAGGD